MEEVKFNKTIAMLFENEEGILEWAISFDGINPSEEDFFVMESQEQAERLSNRINKL